MEISTDTKNKLIQEIKDSGVEGIQAAAKLFQQGFDLDSTEKVLRENLHFFVIADKDKNTITVSVEPYRGEQHPDVRTLHLNPLSTWPNEI